MYALIPLIIVLIAVISFALFLVLTEYKPEPYEDAIKYRNSRDMEWRDEITITTYNTGYASLDDSRDFFMDGGTSSTKITREQVFDNLIGITHQLEDLDSDIYLMQEVDTDGSRSQHVQQVEHYVSDLPDYNAFFGYNYQAKWVPFPLFHPMGSAYSGLLTLSKKQIDKSYRISLEGQEEFPKSIFFPKRAMIVNEYQLTNGKTLYIINVHLSAYDKEGRFRTMQMEHIMRYMEELYDEQKNYIIVGGDFNLLLDPTLEEEDHPEWVKRPPQSLLNSKFKLLYGTNGRTMRSLSTRFDPKETYQTTIDGFIVSPNVEVQSITTNDMSYRYSDHNPVSLTIKIQ